MALRRITIDIEDSKPTSTGQARYEARIQSSAIGFGERLYEKPLTAGKLHTLIDFVVDDVLDTLKD